MKGKHTHEKWVRRSTLAIENMLHCFIKAPRGEGKPTKTICRVDGYPDEAEAFEVRVDLIAAAPETAQQRNELVETVKRVDAMMDSMKKNPAVWPAYELIHADIKVIMEKAQPPSGKE